MFTHHKSHANISMDLNVAPPTVAEICQKILKQHGDIRSVSRESGVIKGSIRVSWNTAPNLHIQIGKSGGDGTKIIIDAEQGEGLLTDGGAQRGLDRFVELFNMDPRIKGNAASGW